MFLESRLSKVSHRFQSIFITSFDSLFFAATPSIHLPVASHFYPTPRQKNKARIKKKKKKKTILVFPSNISFRLSPPHPFPFNALLFPFPFPFFLLPPSYLHPLRIYTHHTVYFLARFLHPPHSNRFGTLIAT